MAGARELILKGLYQIEEKEAYSNKALQEILENRNLAAADRSFATELLMGVVRNKLKLDYIITQFSKIKMRKLSPWVHQILRMGIYQMVCMDNIPDSAACNESVKLAGKYGHGASRGFVNGVLRSVSRNKENISYPVENPQRLSVIYSCPDWLTEKLISQYGADIAERILAASHKQQPLTIRVNRLKITGEALTEQLAKEGCKACFKDDDPLCLYIDGALNVNDSICYKEGLYSIQNISSMAAVKALSPKRGDFVLDLCAAPGGKTAYAAEMMDNCGRIIAFDIHAHKVELIEKTAQRLGISIIEAREQNAEIFQADLEQKADCVLADVPCSGIGVIHKKPDIKWRRSIADITELCKIQKRILENAAKYVKPGGTLVYSTCTVLREENQEQTVWFLNKYPMFGLEEERQLHTYETGGSGFYIAKFIRKR